VRRDAVKVGFADIDSLRVSSAIHSLLRAFRQRAAHFSWPFHAKQSDCGKHQVLRARDLALQFALL
jgi:hypothetical protein